MDLDSYPHNPQWDDLPTVIADLGERLFGHMDTAYEQRVDVLVLLDPLLKVVERLDTEGVYTRSPQISEITETLEALGWTRIIGAWVHPDVPGQVMEPAVNRDRACAGLATAYGVSHTLVRAAIRARLPLALTGRPNYAARR